MGGLNLDDVAQLWRQLEERRHRTLRPLCDVNGISSRRQAGCTYGHRSANTQPTSGASNPLIGLPGMANWRCTWLIVGREASSPAVYGCPGEAASSAAGNSSTIWPAYTTLTTSHTAAARSQIMGDKEHR